MKRISAIMLAALLAVPSATWGKAKTYRVTSPGNNVELTVTAGDSLTYSVKRDGRMAVENVTIALDAGGKVLGRKSAVKKTRRRSVNETIRPVVPVKRSEIPNRYNELAMDFKDGYGVEFRVFDNGVAHRFVTSMPDSVEIMDEVYNVTLSEGTTAHLQQPGGFKTSCEEPYSHKPLAQWNGADRMSELPVLMENGDFILFSESDLEDYPGMFLKGTGSNGSRAVYPHAPLRFGPDGDRSVKILEEAPYIARTAGSRTYPWRLMAMGTAAEIAEQTLVAQLAQPCALTETEWIRPGTASWEWWNGAVPYGDDVDFESGFNMNTYKYFIDFASRYGIPYIVMDEGWAKTTLDPYTPNPEVNLDEIIRYGNEKGVGVFVWLTWLTVENNFEDVFRHLADKGVKGLKIDFMDRSDQWMVNYYERVAREAAKNHILVDLHGAYKPTGLEMKYPNVLSFEGVRGMEQMGGCVPDNSLWFPLMRNAVGPMDYTPGAMISMQPEVYGSRRPNSASIGTRAYQMALFVIFETGLQMLADNPTLYYRNHDCTEFITGVPVTTDETRALLVDPGKSVIIAKRKGDKWYVAGMNGNCDKSRDFKVALDFLPSGRKYRMTSVEDGPNAFQQAMDYRRHESTVDSNTVLDLRMARNGGWAAVIEAAE